MLGEYYTFDVGNTRVKAGRFRGGKLLAADAAAHAELKQLVERVAHHPPKNVAISTVNTAVSDQLRAWLLEHGFDILLELTSDGRLFRDGLLGCDVDTPQTTGVDRLLACLAAAERALGLPVVVIDVGSAATVNLVTADRVFRGGAIFPGPMLMARALHQGTFALPEVKLREPPPPVGRSTRQAIESGIYFALAGGIDRLVTEMTAPLESTQPPAVFLTGGGADWIGPALRTAHSRSPSLVLEGLALATQRLNCL